MSHARHARIRHARIRYARGRRAWSSLVSAGLLLAMLAFVPTSAAQAAASPLTLTASSDASALVDAPIGYTLRAHNSSSTWRYNLSFRDVLPIGVTYKSGSTSHPEGLGDPQIVTTGAAPNTQQVLIWTNVSDLPAGGDQTVSFQVTVDPTRYPVGSRVDNAANAARVYGQVDPRMLPKFDDSGTADPFTDSAMSPAFGTSITAIKIETSEDSPEHELMRGVHDDTAVYTLKVTNNDYKTTNGNTVVDYLPAGLEFLGCGGADNGTTAEYGSTTLAGTPAPGGFCATPVGVRTVQLETGEVAGLDAGVYTEVTWDVGALNPGVSWTTHYRAAIPQRENTMDFGADGTPSVSSLRQASNLDNNTGDPTRELASSADSQDGELGLANLAQVTGTYTGTNAAGATNSTVSDTSSVEVSAEDLAVQKSVSPGKFSQGDLATYTLTVETGEYADASGITITDVIPDGLCPVAESSASSCAASASDFTATNATVTSVVHNADDNTWTVTFEPFDLAHQDSVTISYQALMEPNYTGHDGDPTVSGDDYASDVALVGTTTTLDDVNAPDGDGVAIEDVRDASSATIASEGPSLSKTIMKQVTPYACDSGDYTDNDATAKGSTALTFRHGDRICFDIRVDFSTGSYTRNPVVTDFLPDYLGYESGSPTAADNVTAAGATPVVDGAQVTWTLGTPSGSDRFVPKGGVFEWRISATVVGQPAAAPKPDITANLAKLSWVDTAGDVGFLRDQVDFSIGATPPLAITKTHSGFANGVVGGDVVTYTITVTNTGNAADQDAIPVKSVMIGDVLPTGIGCSAITSSTGGMSCLTASGQPTLLQWPLGGALAPGASTTISYAMTIPADPRVLTDYVNTAGVMSYVTDSNKGSTSFLHHPANTVPRLTQCTGATCDVPRAEASDTVTVKNTALTKTRTTAIGETGNDAASQAAIGEEVTYTVKATVPAHTTVYQGQVTDPMPTGIELLSATADLDGATLPGDVTLTVNDKATAGADSATLTLPATYTNTTASDQKFTIVVSARVTTVAGNTNNTTRTNTATFTRKDAATGGSNLASQTASSTTTVIEPSPSITKSHTPSGKVSGNQTVTYTLTAGNASGRPTLYDASVVDCVPAGLGDLAVTSTPTDTTVDTVVDGDGTNGCATGTQVLRWHLPAIAGGSTYSLKYTVVVDPASAGGQVYTNTATLTGSDLKDGSEPVSAIERQYTKSVDDEVTVVGSSLGKSSSTPLLAVGDVATFTVSATVPADVNYFDAAIVDTLPAGLDASRVSLESGVCTYADSTSCSLVPSGLTASGQEVGWFLGDLTADSKARTIALTYTVPVTDLSGLDASDQLTNSAVLGWDLTNKTDPTSVDATADQTAGPAAATDHLTEPDVSITKAVSDGTPDPGQSFTYTLKASNADTAYTSTAHRVVVTDAVPTGVVVDPDTISADGSLADADSQTGGGTITWTLDALAKGDSQTLTYDATLATPAPSAVLVNTAKVASYCSVAFGASETCATVGGRGYTGPSATAQVSAALPHVSVAKSAVGGDLAYLGKPKSFQITITSDGTSEAYQVGASDTLPANWRYNVGSAQISVLGGTASMVNPTALGQTLTWTDLGDLPHAGDTIVITYAATPGTAAATAPGVGHTVAHTNTVTATAHDANGKTSDKDGNSFNGPDATATVHVDSADLEITKTPVGTPVAGDDFSWTLKVTNHGPDTAVGPFTVTDPMPAALTSLYASGSGWTCGGASGQVTCTISTDLASGSSLPTITVTGHVPADIASDADLDNTATVSGSTYDPDSDNSSDESDPDVTYAADMSIVKKLSGSMTAGRDATYIIDVENKGPSVHRGPLDVTDHLPPGTTFVSVSAAGWSCSGPAVGGTGTVGCSRGDDVPVGTTDQITVVVHVESGRTAPVTNTAEVSGTAGGGTADPNGDNDTSTVPTPPDTVADLSLDKSRVDDAEFVAGKTPSYLLTVHNEGPSDAQNVTISDTLPAYLSYQGFTSVDGDWTCSASGQDVTCTLADPLAASPGAATGDVSVKIQVKIAADHRGDIKNTATVDSTTDDPDSANNTDPDDLALGDVNADLSIAKSHPAGDVVAGEDVTYTLTVVNVGPSKHNSTDGNIHVVDALPAGMTCVSVLGGSCSASDKGTFDYAGDLAVGDLFNVMVVAHVAADAGPATLDNTATVAGPNDQNPTNDTATDDTTVVDQAEIDLTKTVTGANPVRAGETTTFELTAHNAGPSDADDVTVTDTLPAGMTLVDLSGAGWTCDDETVTCSRDTLAADDSKSIAVKVRVGSGVADGTTLRNDASVTTSTDGDDPADNEAHADVDVVAAADLALVKKHVGGSTVVAGTDTSYTLDVHNAGPSDAQGPITITDTLPAGMSYLSADGGWSCSAAGQTVTCTQDGPLLAGADTETVTMLVHVDADVDATATATNSATVTAATTDPTPADNDDESTVEVTRGADVSIVKSHTGIGTIGEDVDFTLGVHNDGPSTARAVEVSDPLPEGLEFVSAEGGADWSCAYDDADRTVTCDHTGPVAADTDADPIHVVATVRAAAYPSVTNVATVATETPDGHLDDNTSSDELEVASRADLSLVKTHTGALVVGDQTHYTLSVHNNGPTEAADTVTVTDPLPAGLTYVSATGDGWTCDAKSGPVVCKRPGLANGATSAIDLVVTVGPAAYPSLTNAATVAALDADVHALNNASDDGAAVEPTVDLQVKKSVAFQKGDRVGWDIAVTNDGPSATVAPAVVVDQLPAELHYESATGPGWDCGVAGQRVTCNRTSALASGAVSTVRVVTTIDAAPGTVIRNVATVSGGGARAASDTTHPGGKPSTSSAKVTAAAAKGPKGSTPANGSAGSLPNTGGPLWWLVPLGALLIVAGGLMLRRRRS